VNIKIGLDYYNVVTQFPDQCWELAWKVMVSGGEVYIISAVGHKRLKETGGLERYREEIEAWNIPNHETEIVVFDKEEDIPQLKLDVCKKYDIAIFIDDRPETVKLLHENGIMALLCPKPSKKTEKKAEKEGFGHPPLFE